MTKVQQIKTAVEKLTPEEVTELARWLSQYDAALWDGQMEADAARGRLDKLFEKTERERASGVARPLDELLDDP